MIRDRAAGLARGVIRAAGVSGPPVPDGVIYSLEPGLKVRVTPMPRGLSAVLMCDRKSQDTIWLASSQPPGRRRFSLWHEIGHYWLHAGTSYCGASTFLERALEREADRFAADVLMPRDWVERECISHGIDVARLARVFQVSLEAMKIRLSELGIL